MFIDKVQAVENKFMDLEQNISDPAVIARQEEWQKLTKEHAALMPIVETFRKYKKIADTVKGDKEIMDDPDSDDDLIAMAKEEYNELSKELTDLEEQLHILMLPKIRTMTKMSLWKSVPVPAVTKQPSLREIYSACI